MGNLGVWNLGLEFGFGISRHFEFVAFSVTKINFDFLHCNSNCICFTGPTIIIEQILILITFHLHPKFKDNLTNCHIRIANLFSKLISVSHDVQSMPLSRKCTTDCSPREVLAASLGIQLTYLTLRNGNLSFLHKNCFGI